MKGFVLKLYSIFILTLQTDGFILPIQTEFHSIQDVCIKDIFSFEFMTRLDFRSSGLLVHLDSYNSKQHQFMVFIEDGDLIFTDGVNNKKISFIIPYDDTEVVNKWNDNRWHKLTVERILDEGNPYVDVKNAIYINCNCLKTHLKIGEDRSEVDKCCQENNRGNRETKKCGGVLGKIKCRNHTTSGVSMSVAACLEEADTCHVNAKSSGLLVHLDSYNSKQHQFMVTIEDGDLIFTDGVNNKKRSFIIPYDDTEVVNKWNDNRWHKLTVERILDEGKYLSVKVLVDEHIHRIYSVMEVKGHVRGSNDVYLGKSPYVDVKNAIYINCNCLKTHLKIGEDRSEVDKCCQENNRENRETEKCGGVLGKIKCRNHTTSGVSMSVAACLEEADTCHVNAKYVYFDTAACCECITPFYGNGIRCLKTGKRLILRGKVSGELNNQALDDLELLAFVSVTTGFIETHLRKRTHKTVDKLMITMQPIGDIIGWMFAVPQDKEAKNGFTVTGGELNRTALIKYQSGETVLITQQFSTISSEFKVQTFIKGTVPDPVDSILFNDFTEQYRRVSRGVIKSCSTRKFQSNGFMSNFTMDQTITFNECQLNPFTHHTMIHVATRNLVMNDRKNDVLRFSSTNQIDINACASDPCVNGGSCTDEMIGYTCTCTTGYIGSNCQYGASGLKYKGGGILNDPQIFRKCKT
ncbi:NID [Mytilus coruscus]|uniref:NID n=1 Tax=Mytilus coruscus TaxID=42192 RepID=A0A6J7ZZJ6_MYTCO|nr:NID [Mytilus coruscus]